VRRPACIERAVGTGDTRAARANDGREREHPAAADAAEKNWRIDHWRGPIGCGGNKPAGMRNGLKVTNVTRSGAILCELKEDPGREVAGPDRSSAMRPSQARQILLGKRLLG